MTTDGTYCYEHGNSPKFVSWDDFKAHTKDPHYGCSQCHADGMTFSEQYDHRVLAHGWGKEDN